MDKKRLAKIKQSLTVKCKQMAESGQRFCASILNDLEGDYSILKDSKALFNSTKAGHVAKFIVSTKVMPLSDAEVGPETEVIVNTSYPLAVMVYVPLELQGGLTPVSWFKQVTGVEPEESDELFAGGVITHEYPFKYQDELVAKSYALITKLGLYNEESDDELFQLPE